MEPIITYQQIVGALNLYLPLDVYFSNVIRSTYAKYGVMLQNDYCYTMIEVIGFTEMMGVLCGVDLSPSSRKIICPLTHLEFDPIHPLTSTLTFFQRQWLQKGIEKQSLTQNLTYH
jgi:hypothetical protein